MEPLKLPGPKARAIVERDQAVISLSYPRGYPFVMDHGRGTEVWDMDGNRFLDFSAGIAVASTGHSHPEADRRTVHEECRRSWPLYPGCTPRNHDAPSNDWSDTWYWLDDWWRICE